MTHHIKNCVHQLVACPLCQEMYSLQNMDDHVQGCSSLKSECEYCHKDFIKSDLEDHAPCYRDAEDLYYCVYGCIDPMPFSQGIIDAHNRDNHERHLKYVEHEKDVKMWTMVMLSFFFVIYMLCFWD
eukprot:TRINITY_DN340_c0_g1_i1.p1 TRINITY_DN340_c0_g1~~TRINITY_DN340_c0_g1_i1.p1  ORF type:complete len:127 (-),score=16.11 TRINITY_DN340_c0_g1_i1:80-460(-)